METAGKALVVAGIGVALLGLVLFAAGRFGVRLPGDILIQRKNFTFYAPLGLMLLFSLLATLLLNLFARR
jgi:hypothetical protein